MKLFSFTVLILQLAAIEAFTGSVRVLPKPAVAGRSASVRPHHMGDIDHDPLPNDIEESLVVYDNVAVALDDDAWEMAMKIVAALVAVALTVGAGVATTRPAFAADSDQLFSSLPTVVLSASIKDDDIVDFSMPSYEAASRAEVNSNLKGDKYLLGEASKNYGSSSSSSSSEETVVEEKAAPVVDEKAEKAAAKAAAKAARAKQQAEIEAAAKAAAGN